LRRPNVLLLTIDTLRADRLGCYGHSRALTPNLDRLAAKGVRFSQAITGGSWTQAAFPVLLTSSYASMYGGCLGPLSAARPSPTEVLSAHGYTTIGFSTSPLLSQTYGYQRGFDYFFDLEPNEKDPFLRRMKGGQRLLREPFVHNLSKLVGGCMRPASLYVSAEELTEQACDWLQKIDQPFFSWIHYMDVHWPYHREERLQHPTDIARAWRDLGHLHRANQQQDVITPAQREYYIQLYEEAVRYTDAQIGRLLEFLTSTGMNKDTIIVVVSDHGEEFLEHGRWGHFENNLYDEILHVPLIIRPPGLSEARVVERQVRTLDIMPTILTLCDCPLPEGTEGSSLTSLWTDSGAEYAATVSLSEMWRDEWHIVAARTEALKYIWDSKQPAQSKLFDLSTDPRETRDVSAQYPAEAQALHRHVEELLRRMERTRPADISAEPELNKEVVERLRGLGYLD